MYANGCDFLAGQYVEVFVKHAVENAAVGLEGMLPGLRTGVLRGIADDQREQVLQDLTVGVVLVDKGFDLFDVLGIGNPQSDGLQIGVLANRLTHC